MTEEQSLNENTWSEFLGLSQDYEGRGNEVTRPKFRHVYEYMYDSLHACTCDN